MTCARRLAGAPQTASPTESPRKPDICIGRRRARLSFLLPALALLLGALSPFAAAPAAADELVSNLGQGSEGTDFDVGANRRAQQFTTGSNTGGYTLTSIEVLVAAARTATQAAKVRAEVWTSTAQDAPGTKRYDLSVPSGAISTGALTLTAPTGSTLDASTAYFLVLYTTDNTAFSVERISDIEEDTSGQTGWSIADGSRRVVSGSWQPISQNWIVMLRVNGAARAGPPPWR